MSQWYGQGAHRGVEISTIGACALLSADGTSSTRGRTSRASKELFYRVQTNRRRRTPARITSGVQHAYKELGQVLTVQPHGAAVNTATSPAVQHAYDTTASSNVFSNGHRQTKVNCTANTPKAAYEYTTAQSPLHQRQAERSR
jgi:hypothetical protein